MVILVLNLENVIMNDISSKKISFFFKKRFAQKFKYKHKYSFKKM